ncbi:MAG: hypothetical protein J1F31_01560 [Erysipelotrichales bacterium]|nr:hypothetical protein [Erysipelotrichales bacterium]
MIDSKTSDEVLIELAKNNSEEAFNMLLFRWNGLITMICVSYFKSARKYGVTFHELKSIAQFSVYNGLRFYDKNKSNFKTYLNLIVSQAIIRCIRISENRYYELSSCLSFDENTYDCSIMRLDEVIPDPESSVVKWYNDIESFEYFNSLDEEVLSKRDKTVMYLRASGYTYHEAATKLKLSKTHTDFTLKKIKKIARK